MSGEERRLAPRDGRNESVTVGTSATVATTIATSKVYSTSNPGYYTFESVGGDITIAIGSSAAMGAPATSGSSKNGTIIPDKWKVDFWLEAGDTHIRAIASAASCTLTWWRSSP